MLDSPLLPLLATLALLLAVQALAARTTSALVRLAGWSAVPWTTGWIGVPVHESAHVLACLLLGRRVRQVRFFAPDSTAGTLGQVIWEPGRAPFAWIAALLVGIAPLVLGTLLLQALARLGAHLGHVQLPTFAATSLAEWRHGLGQWLHLATRLSVDTWTSGGFPRALLLAGWYASACVATHLTPSRADLAGTWRGLGLVLLLTALVILALRTIPLAVGPPLLHALGLVCAWVAPGLVLALVPLSALWLLATSGALLLRRP
jgi:hypothetical protein